MTKYIKPSTDSLTADTNPFVTETPAAESYYRRWISCLSHEIRNPLTLICSSLQLLEKDYPCIKDSPLWEQTKSDIRYLIRLLQDSSAATREYQPHFTEFPLRDLFEELIVSLQPLLEEHRIRIESHIDRDITDTVPVIHADRMRLKEALTNLLINAADALSAMPDSCSRRILLTANILSCDADGAGKAFCLHVRDNGPGIPEEYLDTLFEPFVTHKSCGTGLGLSIVRNIAGLHGGSVSVETAAGKEDSFTDFCLYLPCSDTAAVTPESPLRES